MVSKGQFKTLAFSPHLQHSLGFLKATVLAEMLAAKSYMNTGFLTTTS